MATSKYAVVVLTICSTLGAVNAAPMAQICGLIPGGCDILAMKAGVEANINTPSVPMEVASVSAMRAGPVSVEATTLATMAAQATSQPNLPIVAAWRDGDIPDLPAPHEFKQSSESSPELSHKKRIAKGFCDNFGWIVPGCDKYDVKLAAKSLPTDAFAMDSASVSAMRAGPFSVAATDLPMMAKRQPTIVKKVLLPTKLPEHGMLIPPLPSQVNDRSGPVTGHVKRLTREEFCEGWRDRLRQDPELEYVCREKNPLPMPGLDEEDSTDAAPGAMPPASTPKAKHGEKGTWDETKERLHFGQDFDEKKARRIHHPKCYPNCPQHDAPDGGDNPAEFENGHKVVHLKGKDCRCFKNASWQPAMYDEVIGNIKCRCEAPKQPENAKRDISMEPPADNREDMELEQLREHERQCWGRESEPDCQLGFEYDESKREGPKRPVRCRLAEGAGPTGGWDWVCEDA